MSDEEENKNVTFRRTMESLNQKFIVACQKEVTKASDCVLVPLIKNYLMNLRDMLTQVDEDSQYDDKNSFTNIGKLYDSIDEIIYTTKEIQKFSAEKDMPPKESTDFSYIEWCSSVTPSLKGLNRLSSVSGTRHSSFGNSSRMFSVDDGRRMIISAKASKTAKDISRTEPAVESEPCLFKSASTQCPNYFVLSKQQLNSISTGLLTPPSSFTFPSTVPISVSPADCSSQTDPICIFGPNPGLDPITANNEMGLNAADSIALVQTSPRNGSTFSLPQQQTSAKSWEININPDFFAKAVPITQHVVDTDSQDENDNENLEPPKNEFTPVAEADSVYNIKCKVFNLIGGSYETRGVGQLYIKKLDTGKHQVVVRAENAVGTILLNFTLSKSLPFSKKSATDILIIDPQGNKGEPATVLIRVKSESSGTELHQKLSQFQDACPS